MKRTILILVTLIAMVAFNASAQEQKKISYPLIVRFQSVCCGVPSDSAIRNFITFFKKKYKVKRLTASRTGPMGREGEYYLAFRLNELSKKQKNYFISNIKKIKPLPSDKGQFSFDENTEIDPGAIPKRATTNEVIF